MTSLPLVVALLSPARMVPLAIASMLTCVLCIGMARWRYAMVAGAASLAFLAVILLTRSNDPLRPNPANRSIKLTSDWKLLDGNSGATVPLSSFQGKVVFLNLWATWCGPCMAEMPSIERLYQQFKDRSDVVFVLVSMDDNPQYAMTIMQREGYTVPIYFPLEMPPAEIRRPGIPATFILGKDRSVRLERLGAFEWDSSPAVNVLNQFASE